MSSHFKPASSLRLRPRATLEDWLRDSSDVFAPEQLLEFTDAQSDTWLLLDGGHSFNQPLPPDEDRDHYIRRDTFYVINSYLYRKKDEPKVIKFLEETNFIGRWMPENRERIDPHLAEFYDERFRRDELSEGFWRKRSDKIPFEVLLPAEQYLYESGTYDCSMDETVNLYLPSFYLGKELEISLGLLDGVYFTPTRSDAIAFNLLKNESSYGLMFHKQSLMEFLNSRGLGIFWSVLSEKNSLGGDYRSSPGRLEYSTGALLNKDKLKEHGRKINYRTFQDI